MKLNLNLPPLPIWQARSFYAQMLLALSVVLNMTGIDLMRWLADIGAGSSPDEVIETGVSVWQALSPIVFGLWAWAERRAPNYRLTLLGAGGDTSLRFLGGLAAVLLLIGSAGTVMAQPCAPAETVFAQLQDGYGEILTGSGVVGDVPILLFVNPDTNTWTIVATADGRGCPLLAGEAWAPPPPRGKPL
ncbi:hypothetical protein [Ruixingdingia sedimenti]|uniref:Uncharacterized protein n=1 Tax=Ruixingdingia sedimenti TaxID=3073604 RepID=A0ABU1FEA8_9RHOB|nr:hypothetical protein [Xinfangfangia sp. LG-4]MDR5655234.1 hypothetical protein [Xinfangfangia sp. LG-4]